MNAITMFMMPQSKDLKLNSSVEKSGLPLDKEGASQFEQLLGSINVLKSSGEQSEQDSALTEQLDLDAIKEMLSSMDLDDLEQLLSNLMTTEEVATNELLFEEMAALLNKLLESDEQSAASVIDAVSDNILNEILNQYQHLQDGASADPSLVSLFQMAINQSQVINEAVDLNKLQEQANSLFTQIENLLKQVDSQADVSRVSPKILAYLQQWHQLTTNAGSNTNLLASLSTENKQLSTVWKELVQAFQNRTGMNQLKQYNLDSKVTTPDVIKWLSHAMEAKVQTDKAPAQSAAMISSLPISKVEQFVIHVNQTQTSTSVDKQLVEQFQKIMDANRITSLQNSRGQIAIKLRPANLGEMMVRFTQINGEIAVKILVSTTMAKEMLEGNMKQLRSMFSPHQVVIEKQEATLTQSQETQKEQNSDEHQGTREEQQAHSEDKQHTSDDDSFSSLFEELILNEKV